jgi:hypothetical protein
LSSQTSLSNPTQAQSITLTLQHGILPAFTAWYNQPLQYSMIALLPLIHSFFSLEPPQKSLGIPGPPEQRFTPRQPPHLYYPP